MANKRVVMQVMLVVALVGTFLLAGMPALAQGPEETRTGFADADGDGICDNYGTSTGFVDINGDGICDNDGMGTGFVDTDGDGVCDNCDGLESWTRTRANEQVKKAIGSTR